MKAKLVYAALTDTGKVRTVNQDALFTHNDDVTGLFLVADGMGGHAEGEKASGAIAEAAAAWIDGFYPDRFENGFPDILDDFDRCITETGNRIFHDYNRDQICGTTLSALFVYESYYAVFNIGDSRVYLKRGFSFKQLTIDDVWQNTEAAQNLGEEERKLHSNYGKLTLSLGTKEGVIAKRQSGRLKKGDVFLIVSDGVYKHLPDRQMRRVVTRAKTSKKQEDMQKTVNVIQDRVYEDGASDNLTAMIIRTVTA